MTKFEKSKDSALKCTIQRAEESWVKYESDFVSIGIGIEI
jgi:hypothetical protein